MKILKIGNYAKYDFPFVLIEPDNQPTYPMHVHDCMELVIVRDGTGTHIVDDAEYNISTGDVFVVAGDLHHGYRNTKRLKITNILFDKNRLPISLAYLAALPGFYSLFEVEPKLRKKHEFRSRLRIEEDQMGAVRLILSRIRIEMKSKNPGYKAAIVGIFTELLVFLARSFSEQSVSGESLAVSRLGQVISKIEIDFHSDISLDNLALMAHMSKRTFLRYFSRVFDMSPIKYLLEVRLGKATEMLRHTDRPISEIAMNAGFSDSNYFSRQFKKSKGMTPRHFRERFRTINPNISRTAKA